MNRAKSKEDLKVIKVTGIMDKKLLVALLIVLFFISCSASDSNSFLDYQIYSQVDENDFFLIADNDIYISFSRSRGYKENKIWVFLRSNQYRKIFNIKELSYEFSDGTKGYFIQNIKSKISEMSYREYERDGGIGYFYSSDRGLIGEFKGEDLFIDSIKAGDEKEMKLTLRYSFDNEPLKTEIYDTFIVKCVEQEKEDHWILHYIVPWVYW